MQSITSANNNKSNNNNNFISDNIKYNKFNKDSKIDKTERNNNTIYK